MASASEEYYNFQRKMATLITGNTKGTKDFNTAMRTSADILKDIAKDAQDFSLPIDQYKSLFNDFSALLVGKGAQGDNFKEARKLSRNFMLAADAFPIEPWLAQQQIGGLLEGRFEQDQRLFRLLRDETDAFKGMSAGRFKSFKLPKKVETLNKAFDQYISPEILEARENTITAQMTKLQNSFKSITSVMKELGDVIRTPLIKVLKEVNAWISEKLSLAFSHIAKALKPLTGDLERLYVELDKLSRLGASFEKSKTFSGIGFFMVELKRFIPTLTKWSFLAGKMGGRGTLAAGAGLATMLKWIFKTTSATKAFGMALKFLARSLWLYMKFLVPFTALMRVLDSAKAQAKVADMKRYADELPNVTKKATDLARAFAAIQFPISALINKLGESISFLFQRTWWIENLYNLIKKIDIESFMKKFSAGLIYLYTTLESIITASLKAVAKIGNPLKFWNPVTQMADFMKNYQENMDKQLHPRWDAMNKHFGKYMKDAATPPAPVYVNKGPITIRNQFPENMEPDRIAVAIKDVFLKAEQARVDTDKRMQTFVPASGYAG